VPATKQWHHIVHVGNDYNSRDYVDGQLVTSDYRTGPKGKSQAKYMGIGRGDVLVRRTYNWDRGFFPGYIAIVRAYAEKALTDAEVIQNYEAQKCRYEGVTMPDIDTNFIPNVFDSNVDTDTHSGVTFENANSDDSDSVIDGEAGDDVFTFNVPDEYANTDT
jgi:hypothetical protein